MDMLRLTNGGILADGWGDGEPAQRGGAGVIKLLRPGQHSRDEAV